MSAKNENDQPIPLAPEQVARALDQALAAVAAARTLDELKAARIANDGDRSPLALASAGIGALPPRSTRHSAVDVGCHHRSFGKRSAGTPAEQEFGTARRKQDLHVRKERE